MPEWVVRQMRETRPESGSDGACFAFVRRAFREELGIELPAYDRQCPTVAEELRIIEEIGRGRTWIKIDAGEEREWDVIQIRRDEHPRHAAIVVKPGLMIHREPNGMIRCESYRARIWANRVVAFWRFADAG